MTYPTPHQPGRKQGLWQRISPWQRAGLIVAALILPCCGGLTVIGALADNDDSKTESVDGRGVADVQPIATTTTAAAAQEPAAQEPSEAAPTTSAAVPVVTKKTTTVNSTIPFKTRRVKDNNLDQGETLVRTPGVTGVKTVTWEITYTDGKQTARRLVKTEVTRKPVTKVVAVGTKAASKCDPNYSGCVPIASDVDCAGGSGNGPAYVDGPINVIGSDIYDLDRDGDGVACDS